MNDFVIEQAYPLEFRETDSKLLADFIKNRQSAVLIGMRRVGISNFLRFFLNHPKIVPSFIKDGNNHLFIPVDLNDLVEREVFPFWMLTLKRIVDSVDISNLDPKIKKNTQTLFLDSIQSKNLFLLIDNIRRSLIAILEAGLLPSIFFIRFDRLKDSVTPEFFSNLQGLKDATNNRLSYVFTSFRSLDHLSPKVFTKASLSMFSKDIYLKTVKLADLKIIYQGYQKVSKLKLSGSLENQLFDLVGGFVQYLQLALIILNERGARIKPTELLDCLIGDERIYLQSEELWESFEPNEQAILIKIVSGQKISQEERIKARYLWDTGAIKDSQPQIFSPLFVNFIKSKLHQNDHSQLASDFTKKELLLFNFLQANINDVCEREAIIEAVWPEEEALGVTDWAIDRLVARVRSKIKNIKTRFLIVTVKTRGYKLIQI